MPVTAKVTVNPDLLGDDQDDLPEGVYREGDDLPQDRVELFRADGKVFTMPRRVDPRLSFRYLRDVRKGGDSTVAMANLLGDVLGDGIMDALAEIQLADEEFDQVTKAIRKYALSTLQKSLGN